MRHLIESTNKLKARINVDPLKTSEISKLLKSKERSQCFFQNFAFSTTSQNSIECEDGGARRDRTADLLRARQALSQLSYGPLTCLFFRRRRCELRSVGHVPYVHSLSRPIRALPTKKNPASALLMNTGSSFRTSSTPRIPFEVLIRGNHFVQVVRSPCRRIACYARYGDRASWTKWWVWEDLNFRPHPYQGCALTN
jgi:hypothetical protein